MKLTDDWIDEAKSLMNSKQLPIDIDAHIAVAANIPIDLSDVVKNLRNRATRGHEWIAEARAALCGDNLGKKISSSRFITLMSHASMRNAGVDWERLDDGSTCRQQEAEHSPAKSREAVLAADLITASRFFLGRLR